MWHLVDLSLANRRKLIQVAIDPSEGVRLHFDFSLSFLDFLDDTCN